MALLTETRPASLHTNGETPVQEQAPTLEARNHAQPESLQRPPKRVAQNRLFPKALKLQFHQLPQYRHRKRTWMVIRTLKRLPMARMPITLEVALPGVQDSRGPLQKVQGLGFRV